MTFSLVLGRLSGRVLLSISGPLFGDDAGE